MNKDDWDKLYKSMLDKMPLELGSLTEYLGVDWNSQNPSDILFNYIKDLSREQKATDILKRLHKLLELLNYIWDNEESFTPATTLDLKNNMDYVKSTIEAMEKRKAVNRGLYDTEIKNLNNIWEKYKEYRSKI